MTHLFHNHPFLGRLLFAVLLIVAATYVQSQVPVAIAPPLHFQFLNSSGQPLSNGKIFTYAAGTTTCLNTYVDASGTTQNPCVIPLDSTGSPSNGSTEVGIFLANNSYKFVAFDVNNAFQWSVDQVSPYFGLLNSVNLWTSSNSFSDPVTILATDDQLIFGVSENQTTLDFPPPAGNVTLEFPNVGQTMLGNLSPSINTPIINSVQVVNSPGTYWTLANATPTGTVLDALAVLGGTSASNATVATTSTSSGIIGLCVLNCGTTGNATIQQSGTAPCVFDGATTFNDAVVPSVTTGGDCHDAGAASATNSIGTVTTTNAGAGTYSVILAPGAAATKTICADGTTTTVNANTTSYQVMKNCGFASGALNALNKSFRVTVYAAITLSGSMASVVAFGVGTTPSLGTYYAAAEEVSSATAWDISDQLMCTVTTAGSSGALSCASIQNLVGTGGPAQVLLPSIIGLNLTGPVYIGLACNFFSASASNSCAQSFFTVEQLN
jgi:hypothetical protein